MQDWRSAARDMVESQLIPRNIRNEEVLKAMASVPRHLFVPIRYAEDAYIDRPLPEGCSAELSCLPSAEAAVEKSRTGFPCEWSFTRLPARRALKLQLVLRKGARTTLTKSVGFPAPAGMKD